MTTRQTGVCRSDGTVVSMPPDLHYEPVPFSGSVQWLGLDVPVERRERRARPSA